MRVRPKTPFTDGGGPTKVPARALVFSIMALAVPVLGVMMFPGWLAQDAGVLLWLTALVPAFLLTYYRGWQGSSLGLAGGMAALAVAHLLTEILELGAPNYQFLLWFTATFIAVCVGVGVLAEILKRERAKAEDMALTDVLTGLPNRRHAGIFLDAGFSAAVRGQAVSVVLFDLDDFKELNDDHGHQAGDQVLRRLGAILSRMTRRMDLTARWGGEEFLSVLSDCTDEGAVLFVERVQERLRTERFPGGTVTLSAGIAQYRDGMGSPELLVAAADQALYQAKADGKDRWRISGKTDVPARAPRTQPPPSGAVRRGQDSAAPSGADSSGAAASGASPSGASASGASSSGAAPSGAAPPGLEGMRLSGTLDTPAAPFVEDEGDRVPLADPRDLPGGWERILLVDDDEAAREAIGKILRRLGYVVVEAPSGEAALTKARNLGEVDLLLTDLIMPGMSGFTLGQKVEEALGPGRILYMSGYVQREVSWQGAPGAIVDFLEKPMLPQELAGKVRDLLDRPLAKTEVTVGSS